MLTKNDLQQIRGIVKEEVRDEVRVLDKRLSAKIDKLDQKLDKAQEDISEILTAVIEHHDSLEKRVDHIEEHLDLQKPQ